MQGSQQVIRPDQEDKEGKDALGLPGQVLGRIASLSKAAALGVVEPEEKTTTSDEEMQEEIRQAQAAVDACYRRHAESAGIKVEFPRDRQMTEEELDDLSEQLGDGTGARAKRRREIEQMSAAEMEAEAEEVQEEIKRRKGKRASRLPLVLMLFCLSGQAVEGFTAYDCSNRSNIVESYSLLEPDACTNMGKEGEVETKVYGEIVQIKQDDLRLQVYRHRNHHITVLRQVLSSGRHEVHPLPGTQDTGGLGMPSGEEEREDHHQR
jgi:hypothetical protein